MKSHSILSLVSLFVALAGSLFAQEDSQPEGKSITGLIVAADTVSVKVYREPDLDSVGQLGKDGALAMPLIGDVRLQGLTTSEAALLIEAKLRDGYLVRPEVRVVITSRVIKTLSVNGQVRNPGVFTLPPDRELRISEVLAMAGGLTDIANDRKVTLRRKDSKKLQRVNLRRILGGKSEDIVLAAGDVIFVPEGLF